MQAIDMRKGRTVLIKDELHVVEEYFHGTPGKGRGFVQLTFRAIRSGKVFQQKMNPSDDIQVVSLVAKDVQFMYKEDDRFHFMEMVDYQSVSMSAEQVGDAAHYLVENGQYKMRFYGEDPVDIELPASIVMKIIESDPGVKGNSATNVQKPAKLETGYMITVPLFINQGEEVKIDTRTGQYLGRA